MVFGTQYPRAVTATPDNGFTIVGGEGDAFIAHFVPKPVSAINSRSNSQGNSLSGFHARVAQSRLIVTNSAKTIATASLFDVSGKRIDLSSPLVYGRGVANGRGEVASVQFDVSKLAHGTYFIRLKSGTGIESMKIVY
jgi:hypothetical protein